MFAQITTFRFRSASAPKVVSAFDRELMGSLQRADGFLTGELFTRSRLNKGVAIFYWSDEYSAMKHRDSGDLDRIWDVIAPYLIGDPDMEGYEPNILRPSIDPGLRAKDCSEESQTISDLELSDATLDGRSNA